jgi:hypothetical protein
MTIMTFSVFGRKSEKQMSVGSGSVSRTKRDMAGSGPVPQKHHRRTNMNMVYCRFQNTLKDLQDCYEHMDDNDLSEEEARAREQLIRLIEQIAYDYGEDEDEQRGL